MRDYQEFMEYSPLPEELGLLFFDIAEALESNKRLDADIREQRIGRIHRNFRRYVFDADEAFELLDGKEDFTQVIVESRTSPDDDTDQEWVCVTLANRTDGQDVHKSLDYMIYKEYSLRAAGQGERLFEYNLSKRLPTLAVHDPVHGSTEGMSEEEASFAEFVENEASAITQDDVNLLQKICYRLKL